MGDKPAVLVCGLGRCGTSLVMQMLARAGVQCLGSFPDFETDVLCHRPIPAAWLSRRAGIAMKVLDPHYTTPPPFDQAAAVAIWLDRDPREQAASQLKFLELMIGAHRANRDRRRHLASVLPKETSDAILALGHRPMARLNYEDLIQQPPLAASQIARLLAPWWPGLSTAQMASAVRKRDARCARGLEMEESLICGVSP